MYAKLGCCPWGPLERTKRACRLCERGGGGDGRGPFASGTISRKAREGVVLAVVSLWLLCRCGCGVVVALVMLGLLCCWGYGVVVGVKETSTALGQNWPLFRLNLYLHILFTTEQRGCRIILPEYLLQSTSYKDIS